MFCVLIFILLCLIRWLGWIQVTIIDTPRGLKPSPTVQGPPSLGYQESIEIIRTSPIQP